MARITGITYTRDELLDIMVAIVEGGIDHWARTDIMLHDMETMRPKRVVLFYDEDGDGLSKASTQYTMTINDIQAAINKIMLSDFKGRSRNDISSGDVGRIDAEAADVIAQYAVFGEVVYG